MIYEGKLKDARILRDSVWILRVNKIYRTRPSGTIFKAQLKLWLIRGSLSFAAIFRHIVRADVLLAIGPDDYACVATFCQNFGL